MVPLILLTLSPGVDTLLVIRNTQRGGWRDGLLTSLGICSGLFGHATLSALGISLLLQSAWAFTTLKLLGACYLVWLGVSSLRSARHRDPASERSPSPASTGAGRALIEGLLSNLLNPKTAVFYLAFLPQFVDPARPPLSQSFYLAGVHFGMSFLWLGLLAVMLGRLGHWFQREKIRRSFEGITGATLVFFGFKLALTRL
nr:LysE family translocator [Motiliproteus sp. SC1-56]